MLTYQPVVSGAVLDRMTNCSSVSPWRVSLLAVDRSLRPLYGPTPNLTSIGWRADTNPTAEPPTSTGKALFASSGRTVFDCDPGSYPGSCSLARRTGSRPSP
jgi:hypothetical protein